MLNWSWMFNVLQFIVVPFHFFAYRICLVVFLIIQTIYYAQFCCCCCCINYTCLLRAIIPNGRSSSLKKTTENGPKCETFSLFWNLQKLTKK